MQTFASFGELAENYRSEERREHEQDVRKADNLRRSRSIAHVRPGAGPRIAR